MPVFVGPKPGWTGPVLAARAHPDADPDERERLRRASADESARRRRGGNLGAPSAPPPIALQGASQVPTKLTAARSSDTKAFAEKPS